MILSRIYGYYSFITKISLVVLFSCYKIGFSPFPLLHINLSGD